MKLYRLRRHGDALRPTQEQESVKELGKTEVRVRVEAASLNYRDLDELQGGDGGYIPLSDAAGRVDAVGADVQRWKIGDRVAVNFFPTWTDGPFKQSYLRTILGSESADGVPIDTGLAIFPDVAPSTLFGDRWLIDLLHRPTTVGLLRQDGEWEFDPKKSPGTAGQGQTTGEPEDEPLSVNGIFGETEQWLWSASRSVKKLNGVLELRQKKVIENLVIWGLLERNTTRSS